MGGNSTTLDAFRRLWEAYGRGRREELIRLVDDACELHAPAHRRAYRGHEGLRALLSEHDREFKSVTLTYERAEPIDADRLLVVAHVVAFDHRGARTLDEPLICVLRFGAERLVAATAFDDADDAFAHAGVAAPPGGR